MKPFPFLGATPAPARDGRWRAVLAGGWLVLALALQAQDPGRVIVFGTVERFTPRGAPVKGLDDAAFDQDLAEIVATAAQLPYRFVEKKTFPEVMAAFERGEIDVIPSLGRVPERLGKMLFSVRHTVSTHAVFVRAGTPPPRSIAEVAALRLAVVGDSSGMSYVKNKGWHERIQVLATTGDALRAVQSGRAEACIANQLVGVSVLRELDLEREVAAGYTLPDFSVDYCMAVQKSNVDLLARLNDGIFLSLERGDLQRNREKWLPVFESYWLSRQNIRRWGVGGGLALLLAVGLGWLWHRGRLRAQARMTQEVSRLVKARTRELAETSAQLAASQEIFAKAFRASPDSISITRVADGRLIDVNEGFTRTFGYARDEAIGRSWLELGLWLRPEERTPMMETLRAHGHAREVARSFRRKDGAVIDVVFSSESTTIGAEECVVTISRDVTEQKRLTEELHRGHQLNEAIINTAHGLIVSLDRQGLIVQFNPACEHLTGWRASEVVGRCVWEVLVPPEQRDTVRQTFESLAAGMFPNRHENDWLTRDGRRRWIAWANSALLNAAGEIELILGTGVDITTTRDMTEALRMSDERYQLAVRGSSAGLWDWNLRTDEVFYSPRFKEMLGYADADFAPHVSAFFAVLHPDDQPAVATAIAEHLSPRNTVFDIEYRLRAKDGTHLWIHARGEALKDSEGQAHRMAGSIVDITERKAAENALRKLNAELESRVESRTAELAARVAEVENLNHELESFSYSVSHDLRAPLRNITGFLELLVKRAAGRLDKESERFVSVVTNETVRMGLLIDDLLTFSRIGRTEMALEPVALEELVAEVREELRIEQGDRVVEWQSGALPAVRGDRTLLRQVVANLLGNAVKFTRGRPRAVIEIGAAAVRPGDPTVTIFVRDNGAGYNPKYQDKLFGVFQRLHNARDFDGTGIGLANVKRIIDRHGGRVWAEGAVDRGATFYFTLPAAGTKVSPP